MSLRSIVVSLFILLLPVSALRAEIIQAVEHEGVGYFIQTGSTVLKRYDYASESWLPHIELTQQPSALVVDEYIYIGIDRYVFRINKQDETATHLRNTTSSVSSLSLLGDNLYIVNGATITGVSKLDGTFIGDNISQSSYYSMRGYSAAPSINKIFGLTTGVSPADIRVQNINLDGTLGAQTDSPYHGSYSIGSKSYVFPGDARVADNSGVVYHTTDLSFAGSFAGSFDDLAFWGDLPIVLRGDTLYAYSTNILESGQSSLINTAVGIHLHNDDVFAYRESVSGDIFFERTATSSITSLQPGDPLDPNGLAYTAENVMLDEADKRLYLLDRESLSIFVWDIENSAYLPSIPLVFAPTHSALDATANKIYLGYADGKINVIDLSVASPQELAFATLPASIRGLAVAGGFIFAADPSGAWATHYSYGSNGALISSVDWNYLSDEYVWNDVLGKMFYFSHHSPRDLYAEEIDKVTGVIGSKADTPFHSSEGMTGPIHVSPDGTKVLLGSGRVFNAATLALENTLSNNIEDALWLDGGDTLITAQTDSSNIVIQEWSTSYASLRTINIPGSLGHVIQYENKILLTGYRNQIPFFELFDLDALPDSDDDGVDNFIDNCVSISNADQADADNDDIGDACDDDADNDGIPNDVETAAGLNPNDSSDAGLDKDGDSFSNIYEYIRGTDINDITSFPAAIADFVESFELGELSSLWAMPSDTDASWLRVIDQADHGTYSLKSADIGNSQTAAIEWQDDFAATRLTFSYRHSTESCCDRLIFSVDGVQQGTINQSIQNTWTEVSVDLIEGMHTLRWVYYKDGSVSSGEDAVWIDNLRFTAVTGGSGGSGGSTLDSDADGVPDASDNCVYAYNTDQLNTDGDSQGNACDEDDDNDGIHDSLEIQFGLNPLDATDATQDFDGDGLNNAQEVAAGTPVNYVNINVSPLDEPITIANIDTYFPFLGDASIKYIRTIDGSEYDYAFSSRVIGANSASVSVFDGYSNIAFDFNKTAERVEVKKLSTTLNGLRYEVDFKGNGVIFSAGTYQNTSRSSYGSAGVKINGGAEALRETYTSYTVLGEELVTIQGQQKTALIVAYSLVVYTSGYQADFGISEVVWLVEGIGAVKRVSGDLEKSRVLELDPSSVSESQDIQAALQSVASGGGGAYSWWGLLSFMCLLLYRRRNH